MMFFRQSVLDNGLSIISEYIDSVRSVALGIWFRVGSRDETSLDSGMSHFIEHMIFKGTPSRTAAEISQAFDSLGADLNAFTSKEYTCYYSRAMDENLPTMVELLSDMICKSTFAEDACSSERKVVMEEIARAQDAPDDCIHDLFASALWPGHPLGAPILGTSQSVAGFDQAATRSFRDTHYHAGNCVVAAAGRIDHDELVSLIQSNLVLREQVSNPRVLPFSTESNNLSVITKDTEQSHICLGTQALHLHHPDRFALSIADSILGGGMSSRLFQEIREKRGLAYAVYSYVTLFQDTGQHVVYSGTRPENTQEVIKIVQHEIAKMASEGISEEELTRAKSSIKGHLILGLENTRARMTRLGKSSVVKGELLSIDEIISRIDAVCTKDVARVTSTVLGAKHSLAVIGPLSIDELSCFSG